jgi:hypothetical protein
MGEFNVALLEEYKKLGTPEEFKKALDLVDAVQSLLKSIQSYRKPIPALQKEFEFYLDNHKSFIPPYIGRVIVIKGCKVIGVYDDDMEAITKTVKEHELGTFLVQRVEKEIEVQILSRC